MKILKHQEVLQAIYDDLIRITPCVIPDFLHDNTYTLHPYSMIDRSHTNSFPQQFAGSKNLPLLANHEYRIITTENIWTLHPRLKLGITYPAHILLCVNKNKIDATNGTAISLAFTPKINFELNSLTPVAKVYFLFDDDKDPSKEKDTGYALLRSMQIISPICLIPTEEKYFKKVH